ncbi:MAG: hypothetical protein KatS3mg035_2016 [Bacteroidia bacterium]|nr:MAG: hypothetical protein KatS3mg035_2016 [Bacteroidia bacterium]
MLKHIATCPIDESMKRVMEVYTKTFAVGIDTFTAGQLDTLMEIAILLNIYLHRAVVSARIMLKNEDMILLWILNGSTSPKNCKMTKIYT